MYIINNHSDVKRGAPYSETHFLGDTYECVEAKGGGYYLSINKKTYMWTLYPLDTGDLEVLIHDMYAMTEKLEYNMN